MEMGAEVQFEITDVETMVREVRDHQDILRSLARTLITKTLTKKTVQALAKDKVRNLISNQFIQTVENFILILFDVPEISCREDKERAESASQEVGH